MSPPFPCCFQSDLFTCINKARTSSNFAQIGSLPTELGIIECLNNFPKAYNWKNGFSKLAHSIFIESSSNRHEMSDEFEFWPDRIGYSNFHHGEILLWGGGICYFLGGNSTTGKLHSNFSGAKF